MARTRLIAIAAYAGEHDRIIGVCQTPQLAKDAIMTAHVPPPSGAKLFYEKPDSTDPKLIQMRVAHAGEARYLGRILVDRGSVDTVLAELRKGEPT